MSGVIDQFVDGGYMMWVILLAGLTMLVLAARSAAAMRARAADVGRDIDAVAFWGGFAALLGVLGTAIGVTQAARAVEAAGGVDTALAWGGIRVSLITTVFGLCVFVVGLLLWIVLRYLHARRLAHG